MHCVIAISYLIITDISMLSGKLLLQALLNAVLALALGYLTPGQETKFSLLFADSPLLTPIVRAGHEASPHPQQVLAKAC